MSDEERDDQLIDPPENQGGGDLNRDAQEEEAKAIDPPSNDGGN
jgi:hypothetical protein